MIMQSKIQVKGANPGTNDEFEKLVQTASKNEPITGSLKNIESLNKIQRRPKIKTVPDVSLRPATPVEIRIVVWEAFDVPSDDFEDVSDMYVEVRMNDFDVYGKTDTHYRAAYHYGSWNWRVVFNLQVDQLSSGKFMIDFYIYDKDMFSGNDYICHADLNI